MEGRYEVMLYRRSDEIETVMERLIEEWMDG